MPRLAAAVVAALVLALAGGAVASAGGGRWHRPVPGAVAASFSFDPAAPFVRGRRRGIDLRGPRGAPVRAACTGIVTWAGRVPRGRGVAIRCGPLVATQLGLGAAWVRRGMRVRAGTVVGVLGAGGRLRLGARRSGDRHGYLDPVTLLGGHDAPPPPLAAPPAADRAPRAAPPASAPARPRPRRPARAPSSAAPPALSPLTYVGIGLLAAGLGTGGLLRRRRAGRAIRTRPVAGWAGRYR